MPQTLHTTRDLLILVEKPTEQVMSLDLVQLLSPVCDCIALLPLSGVAF